MKTLKYSILLLPITVAFFIVIIRPPSRNENEGETLENSNRIAEIQETRDTTVRVAVRPIVPAQNGSITNQTEVDAIREHEALEARLAGTAAIPLLEDAVITDDEPLTQEQVDAAHKRALKQLARREEQERAMAEIRASWERLRKILGEEGFRKWEELR